MNNLEINAKVSIDFNAIKKYLADNNLEVVTKNTHKALNSHPEIAKLIDKEDLFSNWINDSRYPEWCEEEAKQGFANFELWNLDVTMVELLYERLVGFDLLNGWSTGDVQRDNGLEEAYNEMLNLCKEYLKNDSSITDKDRKFKKLWQLWADYGLDFWD